MFMYKNWMLVSLLLLCFSLLPGQTPEILRNPGWFSVFNGQDLAGWTTHGRENWYVENGELVCESGPRAEYGYLSLDREVINFELYLEFLQVSDGNSGVFFRSSIDGTKIAGWQVEIAPPGHGTGGIYESYGRGWLVKIPEKRESVLREGEWNQLRIKVVKGKVTTWLNGVKMVSLKDDKIENGRGHIALQIHDGGGVKVRWRNIYIRIL